MINPLRFNKALTVGERVTLLRQGREVGEVVTVCEFRERVQSYGHGHAFVKSYRQEVLVEDAGRNREWVHRSWLKRESAERSDALSYGVRCNGCGEFETACRCED